MADTVRIPIDLTSPQTAGNVGNSFWSIIELASIDLGFWNFLNDVGLFTLTNNWRP